MARSAVAFTFWRQDKWLSSPPATRTGLTATSPAATSAPMRRLNGVLRGSDRGPFGTSLCAVEPTLTPWRSPHYVRARTDRNRPLGERFDAEAGCAIVRWSDAEARARGGSRWRRLTTAPAPDRSMEQRFGLAMPLVSEAPRSIPGSREQYPSVLLNQRHRQPPRGILLRLVDASD